MRNENGKKNDSYILTLGDFFRQCLKSRKIIVRLAYGFALFAFLFYLTSTPLYIFEGTFQDKGKSQSIMSQSFSELMMMGSGKHESEAVTFMKSRKLMENVIATEGGQAYVDNHTMQFPLLKKVKDNIALEYADWTNKQFPILSDPTQPVSVINVNYHSNYPYGVSVHFNDEENYTVFDPSLKEPLKGHVGKNFVHPHFQWTLVKSNPQPLTGKEYDISLSPMENVLQGIRYLYSIDIDKFDKNLIRIKYCDTDRNRGCSYVNSLMLAYQDYLEEEHQRIAGRQLNYLEERQNEIISNLRKAMEDYSLTASADGQAARGFSALQKESDNLSKLQVETNQRLMDIDLESSRLKSMIAGGKCVYYDRYTDRGDPAIINNILQQIRDYERQSDSLLASLVAPTEKGVEAVHEFSGMDLDSAKQLHMSYSKDLSDVQAEVKQHTHIINQVQEPDFEVCSLGTVLQDPVSAERIARASNLLLALKDQNNRTQKEQTRLRQDLDLEKTFLTLHLKQTAHLLGLKENLITQKIKTLQNTSYDLTRQQIDILKKHLGDYLQARLENLQHEKELLNNYLKQLDDKIQMIGEKLINELLVDQHIELTQTMVEELTKLVESKNISSNMELIQSAPVDIAVPPIHPKFPKLVIKTLLGAILGSLIGLAWVFFNILRYGVPATPANLRLNGEQVAGELSDLSRENDNRPLRDKNLDVLRRALGLLEKQDTQSILMVGEDYDISPYLATLINEKGESVILLPLNFQNSEGKDGLLQYLKGEILFPKIVKDRGYDRIATGGVSRHSTELLKNPQFKLLIDKLRSDYKWIIGVCKAPVESAEAEMIVPLFDRTVVCLEDETIEQLNAYLRKDPPTLFVFIEN